MTSEILCTEPLPRALTRTPAEWLRSGDEVAERERAGGLGTTREAGSLAIVAAALVLALLPPAVALLSLVAPAALDRVAGWLAGASVAFSVVAAGRVPAAAILAAMVWKRPARAPRSRAL